MVIYLRVESRALDKIRLIGPPYAIFFRFGFSGGRGQRRGCLVHSLNVGCSEKPALCRCSYYLRSNWSRSLHKILSGVTIFTKPVIGSRRSDWAQTDHSLRLATPINGTSSSILAGTYLEMVLKTDAPIAIIVRICSANNLALSFLAKHRFLNSLYLLLGSLDKGNTNLIDVPATQSRISRLPPWFVITLAAMGRPNPLPGPPPA